MEPQENCYFEKKCCKKRNCFALVIAILAVLFFGVIGAAISETILAALAAVIVLAIVLGIILVITIIYKICKKERNYC